MKKLIHASLLTLVLLALGFTIVLASCPEYEDPALCVAGKWLVVDAAYQDGVQVTLPAGVAYSDGSCGQTNLPIITNVVVENTNGHSIKVKIDGRLGRTPTIVVSYGDQVDSRSNNDKQVMNFKFDLPK